MLRSSGAQGNQASEVQASCISANSSAPASDHAVSSHLQLTCNIDHAAGYAGENVWPIIAALWDQHQLQGTWDCGLIAVEVAGMQLWVQEFGQVEAVAMEQAA